MKLRCEFEVTWTLAWNALCENAYNGRGIPDTKGQALAIIRAFVLKHGIVQDSELIYVLSVRSYTKDKIEEFLLRTFPQLT